MSQTLHAFLPWFNFLAALGISLSAFHVTLLLPVCPFCLSLDQSHHRSYEWQKRAGAGLD